ncbi:zinc ribbon domain-containing protein [Streptomyces sp. NBC_00237]|uniref:transposase n=1 Tax=Streptomyces sp. NBC_00237 TaxID=2975687 RepID=UPI00224CEBAB|nr:transposase [Streptomyces sp. NBC_00237]MCX5200165.1 zinc ribbon domain-containing protein [Streptomyces sp. NBC_00237]
MTTRVLTAVVPAWLNRSDYVRAHDACHASAQLWNKAVSWVRAEWHSGRSPGPEDIRRYVISLPPEFRPLHAHTAAAVAYDLAEAIATTRTGRAHGMQGIRFPWREKAYRPLMLSARSGWRLTPGGRLALSLGRGRERIIIPVPEFTDREGQSVDPDRWGEMKLCWDSADRRWSLHITHRGPDDRLAQALPRHDQAAGTRVVTVAVDEGVINSMTMASRAPDGAYEIAVINGRSARSIKRGRNKRHARLQSKLSRCRTGSRRHRRLTRARKKLAAKTRRQLKNFNHQVTAKANGFVREQVEAHWQAAPEGARVVVQLVVGDVRGIERDTARKRRASPSTRQQLSQWERGVQERQLAYKTGLRIKHISEAYSSQSCPFCLTRRKVRGRTYVCVNPNCALVLHRDAVGGVNIHTLAVNDGAYVPVPPATEMRVKYLRAVPGWSPDQRERHGSRQVAAGRAGGARGREARGSARNRALHDGVHA